MTRTPAYGYLNAVIVAEITTTIRGIPQEVSMDGADGLPYPSVANLDNIHVVPKRLLATRLGTLAHARHALVKRALGYALDWAELKTLP